MNDRGRERGRQRERERGAPWHAMPNWKKLKEEEEEEATPPLWAPFHSAVYDGVVGVGRGFILPLYGRRRRRVR